MRWASLLISPIFGKSVVSEIFAEMMISAISDVWSPILSMSVIIFKAAEICRRSLATGCCCSRSLRHSRSISRSDWSISASFSMTSFAFSISPSCSAFVAFSIAVSQSCPICVSCSFSETSSLSNLLRILYFLLPVISRIFL